MLACVRLCAFDVVYTWTRSDRGSSITAAVLPATNRFTLERGPASSACVCSVCGVSRRSNEAVIRLEPSPAAPVPPATSRFAFEYVPALLGAVATNSRVPRFRLRRTFFRGRRGPSPHRPSVSPLASIACNSPAFPATIGAALCRGSCRLSAIVSDTSNGPRW